MAVGPMMPGLVSGSIAVITGSSKGIGAGIAEALAQAGATVAVCGRSGSEAESQAESLTKNGYGAMGFELDVTDSASCARLVDDVRAALGHVDLLVNNAGISGRAPLVEMDDDAWDRMISVNLTGVERMTRAVVPHMVDRGAGSIVSISSIAGRAGKANMSHYCATKFGVIGFTQALALELAPFNVRVNCVCPGIVRTRLWEVELQEIAEREGSSVEAAWKSTLESIPLGRAQTALDIGAAVAFLASPLASNITGQSLNVDGGFVMS
jgi:NAD(P)-dependent dehydrogenase (short-subunit alcohol dehydrogenase family)